MYIKIMSDIITLLQRLNSDISSTIKVCMPASIESYDYKTQQASVKISMKELYSSGKEVDYPVISNVPVIFATSGGASITMPVLAGDTCLVLFADRDLGKWLRGGVNKTPDSNRMHDLSDAVAIMGLLPFTKKGGAINNEDLRINYAGSSISITKDGEINITTTKNVNVKSVENINIESKNVSIKATELLSADSKTATLNITESATVGSKNLIFNVAETATTTCKDVVITASGEIKSSATKFTHTGDLVITGNVETTGSITATGAIKSGSVVLGTHKHSYVEPVANSSPTVVIAGVTGAAV